MKKYLSIGIFALSLFVSTILCAQEKREINEADYTNQSVSMADSFREDGKIYVVVAVVVALLGGLIVYVVRMDLKVTGLEKQVKEYLETKK